MGSLNSFFAQQSQRALQVARTASEQAHRMPVVGVLADTIQAYAQDRASTLAAALSYYTLLSLFPLMLFILAVSSSFLQSAQAVREVARFVGAYLPPGLSVGQDLQEMIRLRDPLTLIGGVGFLWSSSGVFDLVQLGLNRAFRVQHARPLWRQRIVSLVMVIAITLLFGLSFFMTAFIRLAVHYRLVSRHDIAMNTVPQAASIILGVFVFALLYRYIPFDPTIRWKNVWWPALLASALWEIAKLAFAWYITNMALLNFVYGSIGAVIALMIWGYITAVILLAGAEMAAVLSGARQRIGPGIQLWELQPDGPANMPSEGAPVPRTIE
ncbi:MAG: YihY/virulence factor BrkB family protein [Chloroflexi bacterium]|nr:YihY/virulence factor BrkB family protein [Chloroflexota bacterium]